MTLRPNWDAAAAAGDLHTCPGCLAPSDRRGIVSRVESNLVIDTSLAPALLIFVFQLHKYISWKQIEEREREES